MNTPTSPAQADAFDNPADIPPEVAAVPAALKEIKDSVDVIARARALVVSNPEEYVVAGNILQELRGVYKRLEDQRKGITDPMRASLQKVMDLFKPKTDAAQAAGEIVRKKLSDYDAEQRRKAEEERRRVEAEARKQREAAEARAREEQAAADARAKAQREEAEARQREQEASERRARELREAEERAANEAAAARAQGDAQAAADAEAERERAETARREEETRAASAAREAAEAQTAAEKITTRTELVVDRLQEKAMTVAPLVVAEQPKVAGLSRRLVWKAEVTDLRALVKAVAEGRAPLMLLLANDKVIGQQARSLQKDFIADGVRVWSETDVAARAK